MTDTKKIIEINGIKLEVDLSTAKVIDNYKIGDSVKVLIKGYEQYESYVGVIVGFDNFEHLPTIIINYIIVNYSTIELKTLYYNADSKEQEITLSNEHELKFDYENAIELLNKDILSAKLEVEKAERKLTFFKRYFNNKIGTLKTKK